MKPYFENDENWNIYKAELESWIGTPYRHLTMVKGRGADCALYMAAVMLHVGILTKVEHDWYPRDWFRHTTKERILEDFFHHIDNNMPPNLTFAWLGKDVEKMRGDAVVFCTAGKGASNHCGILLNEKRFINSIESGGVQILTYGSWWERRLKSIFRVMVR